MSLRKSLLWLPSRLYGLGMKVRNSAFEQHRLEVVRVARPVISVGNLRVGGTGKTPTTLWLTQQLEQLGYPVGIVSRGYGRRGPSSTMVVVSEGDGPLVSAEVGGDEPVLLAQRSRAVVVVCSDRGKAARQAIALGAQVLVADDGFQHRYLHRDLDILLLDSRGLSDDLLPLGRLREPFSQVARAGHLLTIGETFHPSLDALAQRYQKPLAKAQLRPSAWISNQQSAPPTMLKGKQVVLLSAIARPERFLATVLSLGAEVVGHHRFADHFRISSEQLQSIRTEAGSALLLTTEKDFVRMPSTAQTGLGFLQMDLSWKAGEALLRQAFKRVL